jgi:4-amino-4-deoxy-L-arabinose transferase-like glycosyltransferase
VTDRRALGLLTLLLLVLSLPFIHRAYFVDDYYFVTMAKGILDHPARPYDFVSDDAGRANVAWERGQPPRMVNPPLFHYFLAAVIALWGDETWKLRMASLLFPLMSLFAAYFLGKRFVRNSFAAASLLAVTPAFWLTSYSLLLDSALLAFFLASLACFVEGQERHHKGLLITSGVLIGLTLLTKYTGGLIYPVILFWHFVHRQKYSWIWTTIVTGISAVIFLLWGVWGILTYGEMHFFATLSRGFHSASLSGSIFLGFFIAGAWIRWYAPSKRKAVIVSWVCWAMCASILFRTFQISPSLASGLEAFYLDKAISVSSFLGGTTVFLFFAPILLGFKNQKVTAGMGLFALLLFICFRSSAGGFDGIQSAMLAFFIGSTLCFLILLAMEIHPSSDRSRRFLLAWLLLGFLELIIVMPWTAARYVLIILPPACWLFRRIMEESKRTRLWKAVWGMTALMGLAIAYVDYAQANVVFPIAKVLESQRALFDSVSSPTLNKRYYLADTFDGSQPYIEAAGWESVFPDQAFKKGDLFLRATYRRSSWWRVPHRERFQLFMEWEYPSRIPLRVMDVPASAGFYASVWGSLPYVITSHPLERFELYLVQ